MCELAWIRRWGAHFIQSLDKVGQEIDSSPIILLNILEAFEVEAEDLRYLLHLHPLLGFLQTLTHVTEELVLCI